MVDPKKVVSTLQGGGGRGHRIDAEAAGGGISSWNERVAPTMTACGGPEGGRTDKIPVAVVSALTANGVGTCGPDDNQAQAGHLIVEREREREQQTFQKVIRSGARDVNGELPPEVWAERHVAATLNLNDLGPESRTVELVVESATGGRTHTLTGEGHDSSEDGSGRGTPIIAATLTSGGHTNSNAPGRRQEDDVNLVTFGHANGMDLQPSTSTSTTLRAGHDTMPSISTETTVRRLTPTECERLQGFPDGHTATSNGKAQADSARYKQMGNAVAVPVFDWVIGRLVAVDGAE